MNYPPLRMQVLLSLVELKEKILADPEFLEKGEVPYDGDTLKTLKTLLAPQVVTNVVEKTVKVRDRGRPAKDALSAENQDKVSQQLMKLLEDLEAMGESEADQQLPTNERVQITKTKASIVKQVLAMQESATNVKKVSEFMETVVGILDDLVSEKDREVFLNRMEQFR